MIVIFRRIHIFKIDMKKFPIIVAVAFFAIGLLVTLTWFNLIGSFGNFYIPNYSPIKADPLLSLTSRFIILLIFISLGCSIYLHYKKNPFSLRIIAFFYSVVLIDNFYSLIQLLYEILLPTEINLHPMLKVEQPTLTQYLPLLATCVFYTVVASICLRIILPQLNTKRTENTGKLVRLSNYIVDILIMSQILFGKLPMRWIKYISEDELALMFVVSATHIILFYFFFELVYRRTPGKFLTNTSVETINNTRPSLTVILLRTLFRLIPLEAISFLFSANWHDRFSKTRVS